MQFNKLSFNFTIFSCRLMVTFRRYSRTCRWAFSTAQWRAFLIRLSTWDIWAPLDNRKSTVSRWPFQQAKIKGVIESLVLVFMSPPWHNEIIDGDNNIVQHVYLILAMSTATTNTDLYHNCIHDFMSIEHACSVKSKKYIIIYKYSSEFQIVSGKVSFRQSCRQQWPVYRGERIVIPGTDFCIMG